MVENDALIEPAVLIFKDEEKMKAVRCSRHAAPGEVIAALLHSNDKIMEDVIFWLDSYNDDDDKLNIASSAIYDH